MKRLYYIKKSIAQLGSRRRQLLLRDGKLHKFALMENILLQDITLLNLSNYSYRYNVLKYWLYLIVCTGGDSIIGSLDIQSLPIRYFRSNVDNSKLRTRYLLITVIFLVV